MEVLGLLLEFAGGPPTRWWREGGWSMGSGGDGAAMVGRLLDS
jgi:hypothetical protein